MAHSHKKDSVLTQLQNFRYRVENLLVTYMTPGPSEPNGEQLQSYQQTVVDDMLQLWDGMVIPTPKRPEGSSPFHL